MSEDFCEEERNLLLLAYDRDPRVRATAVQGIEVLCSGDMCFSFTSYRRITKLCDDTDARVRVSALRIILIFAEKFPDKRIMNSKGLYLRLHDDAFAVVCHAINDNEAFVRAEASKLLGQFSSVSDFFLQQTLDKKLMRQMKMVGDSSTSLKSNWSTGKKLGEDVPMEKDDEDNNSLMPSGACGAFVTALEDEFMAVRQAAVHSLGRLAANRQDFACLCIDHLADMFNDEIQQVRLDAIYALAPLVDHGSLQQEQLYTILTVLDDAAAENRMAVHDLIARSNLADAECVRQCIRVLLHSLKRFPIDKPSIYKCLSAIGLKHSLFIHGLVTELLEIHPIFDTPEQNIDDDFYLGKLIAVLNAASKNSIICSLIPPYVKKHYRYLRCTSSDLIPIVQTIEESKSMTVMDIKVQDVKEGFTKFVKIIEPSKNVQNDVTIRFVASLPIGIQFSCLLFNFTRNDIRQFRIRIRYPDQSIVYFRPKDTDFHYINDKGSLRLHTIVVVSAAVWAEPANIQFICGLLLPVVVVKTANMYKVKDLVQTTDISPIFEPLLDEELPNKPNEIFVKIHPMQRA